MRTLARLSVLVLLAPWACLAQEEPRAVLVVTPPETRSALASATPFQIEIDLPEARSAEALRRPGAVRMMRVSGEPVTDCAIRAQGPVIDTNGAVERDLSGRALYRRAVVWGPFRPGDHLVVLLASDGGGAPKAVPVAAAPTVTHVPGGTEAPRLETRVGAGGGDVALAAERVMSERWRVLEGGGQLRRAVVLTGQGSLSLGGESIDHRFALAPVLRLDVTPRLGGGRAWPVRIALEPLGVAGGGAAGVAGLTTGLRVSAPLPAAGRLMRRWLEARAIDAYAAAPVLTLSYRAVRPLVPGHGRSDHRADADLVAAWPLDDAFDLDIALRTGVRSGLGGFTPSAALGLTWWRDRARGFGLSIGLDARNPDDHEAALTARMRVPLAPSG
ncbi:hypothetical protein [Marinivivus vitaminiproducens]|uniref:hypothetical protein n=1 Tax=Marinivivus vitaminiproducens TaxID=3035935 RepID=UPI0027A6068A|nr:hypothetical protein P4R82_02680 [Geminicoccaceae bacterium SCSIO 64248]